MLSKRAVGILSRQILKNYARLNVRHINYDGEIPSKSYLSMISKEDDTHNYIISYSNIGFQLSSGISILGPCAIFPRAVLHWNVFSAEQINEESLSLFNLLEPKIDILIIGKGDWESKVNMNVWKYLRQRKINFEILPTEQACAAFNFLNSERRVVAAAIIPPKTISDEFQDDFGRSMLKLDKQDVIGEVSANDKLMQGLELQKDDTFENLLHKVAEKVKDAKADFLKDKEASKTENEMKENQKKDK